MARDTLSKVERFLFREARLMDGHALKEWLELWTEDCLYWVPSNRSDTDPSREVSIIYADRASLEFLLGRLASGAAWAQDPPSRLCRVVGNVEIENESSELVVVHSVFNLTELRRHAQRTFAGRVEHHLRPERDSFRIAYKKVDLVLRDEVIDNLTFLL